MAGSLKQKKKELFPLLCDDAVLNMVLFAHISWREISAAPLMRD